jgi:hypothetical protein
MRVETPILHVKWSLLSFLLGEPTSKAFFTDGSQTVAWKQISGIRNSLYSEGEIIARLSYDKYLCLWIDERTGCAALFCNARFEPSPSSEGR